MPALGLLHEINRLDAGMRMSRYLMRMNRLDKKQIHLIIIKKISVIYDSFR